MINEKAFEQAIPLAAMAASKGLFINAVEGSPLHKLSQLSVLSDTGLAQPAPSQDEVDFNKVISSSHLNLLSDNDAHNAAFDDAVKFLSGVVATHVSNAKNIIAPLVMAVADGIIKRMADDPTSLKTYEIVQNNLPSPMLNEGFKDLIDRTKGGVYAKPEDNLFLGQRTAQQILDLMLTGSKEYDDSIREWFIGLGDAYFVSLWDTFFRDPHDPDLMLFKDTDFMSVLSNNSKDEKKYGCNFALAIFLLSRGLMDNVQENSGLSLERYTVIVGQYRDAAAVRLAQDYEAFDLALKSGTLVEFVNNFTMTVTVNGPVYVEYLKAGGSNELILGAIVSQETPTLVSHMEGKDQVYMDAWNRYHSIVKASNQMSAFGKFKDHALSSFNAELSNRSTFEQEYIDTNPGHETYMTERVNQILNELKPEDISNPYELAMRLVCQARFYYTDAESILRSIDQAGKQNPNIDVREAALIATIEYCCKYLANQMRVVS